MATYKNISDDWYITLDGGIGTIYIDGNLDITGNITYVSEIAVNDAFIIVAANNNGTVNDMGLVATKVANSAYAGLRFDVAANAWQISSSVYANGAPISAYQNIPVGGGNAFVAGSNTQVQFNEAGVFGASANLTFDYSDNKLTVQGHEVLGNIVTTPVYAGNGVALYNKVQGGGGTGLYVINSSVDDELVSKSKAIVFSIIF
jgi:hypothetical protein